MSKNIPKLRRSSLGHSKQSQVCLTYSSASIISPMSAYHFSYPIEVRYGDLDPQGHVNNAKYLTYMEQARVG